MEANVQIGQLSDIPTNTGKRSAVSLCDSLFVCVCVCVVSQKNCNKINMYNM